MHHPTLDLLNMNIQEQSEDNGVNSKQDIDVLRKGGADKTNNICRSYEGCVQ